MTNKTEYDFKGALAAIDKGNLAGESDVIHIALSASEVVAATLALRLADQLLNQEVSEGMTDAGIEAWERNSLAIVTQFKAMLAAAVKEVEGV